MILLILQFIQFPIDARPISLVQLKRRLWMAPPHLAHIGHVTHAQWIHGGHKDALALIAYVGSLT